MEIIEERATRSIEQLSKINFGFKALKFKLTFKNSLENLNYITSI